MPVDQPQAIRVVCVPDSEQLARPRFFRHQFDLSVVSVANNKFERVDVPFKQPPQWQASRTNRRRTSLRDKPAQPCPPNLRGKTAVRRPDS